MRLRDLLEDTRDREHDCPCCYQRFSSFTERFDHVLRVHAWDFEEALEILDEAMMPYFNPHYVTGPESIECIGVTHDDYVQLLLDEGDSLARHIREVSEYGFSFSAVG